MLNMVKDGYLRKEGAARSTIYVKNTEGRYCSMDTDKVIQDLNRRFAASLPEFYQRCIIL